MSVLTNKADFEIRVALPQTLGQKKITEFTKLAAGWNFGAGKEFLDRVIIQAKQADNLLVQLLAAPTDAFPGSNGEIMVTAYKDDYYLEYTLHGGDEFSVRAIKGNTVIQSASRVGQREALSNLVGVAQTIWGTSGSSTPNITMITAGTGSIGSLLMVYQPVGLPSSDVSALTEQGSDGASTLLSSTHGTRSADLSFSGNLDHPSYPTGTR